MHSLSVRSAHWELSSAASGVCPLLPQGSGSHHSGWSLSLVLYCLLSSGRNVIDRHPAPHKQSGCVTSQEWCLEAACTSDPKQMRLDVCMSPREELSLQNVPELA